MGVEHLKWQSKEYTARVVREAVSHGVNYLDLVWSLPQVIEGVSQGIGDNKETRLAVIWARPIEMGDT